MATSKETFDLMSRSHAEVCPNKKMFFTGYTDTEEEGQWRNVNTGDLITWASWAEGEPNGGQTAQCSIIKMPRGEMVDVACTQMFCPICQVKVRGKLQLSGVCSQSRIDRFYVFKSESELMGMTSTRMIFSSRSLGWEIVDRNDEDKIFAFTNQSEVIPLGKHRWYFEDDSCGDLELNLHREVEKPGHFCCDDGSCIDSKLVCNNFPDCQDGTDEEVSEKANCSLLVQPGTGYKKHLPSIGYLKGEKTDLSINATFTVLKVVDVNEDQSFVDIFFKLQLEWFDKGLNFKFLKYSDKDNFLGIMVWRRMIWRPEIIFHLIKTPTDQSHEDQIFVSRRTPPTLAKDEITEIYPGQSNSLTLLMVNRMIFICSFDSTKYPFEKAADCKINFYLPGVSNNLTDLKPRLVNEGPAAIGQYLLESWTIQSKTDETLGKIVEVRLVLSRKLTSIFMVTYLPTILMNIINQATNYISGDTKYDLIYTINITCMMVLASIYLSVSASLPSTANIKPVEVWLLFNLAFPLLVILVNVLLQVGLSLINHVTLVLLNLLKGLEKTKNKGETREEE